jgi:hypothetical protein
VPVTPPAVRSRADNVGGVNDQNRKRLVHLTIVARWGREQRQTDPLRDRIRRSDAACAGSRHMDLSRGTTHACGQDRPARSIPRLMESEILKASVCVSPGAPAED